jgi:hypothetical protein
MAKVADSQIESGIQVARLQAITDKLARDPSGYQRYRAQILANEQGGRGEFLAEQVRRQRCSLVLGFPWGARHPRVPRGRATLHLLSPGICPCM